MIAGWYHVAGSRGVAPAWLQMSSTTACRIEGGSPVGTMMYPSASRSLRLGSGTAGTGCALFQLPSPSFMRAAVEPPTQHPRTGPGSPRRRAGQDRVLRGAARAGLASDGAV